MNLIRVVNRGCVRGSNLGWGQRWPGNSTARLESVRSFMEWISYIYHSIVRNVVVVGERVQARTWATLISGVEVGRHKFVLARHYTLYEPWSSDECSKGKLPSMGWGPKSFTNRLAWLFKLSNIFVLGLFQSGWNVDVPSFPCTEPCVSSPEVSRGNGRVGHCSGSSERASWQSKWPARWQISSAEPRGTHPHAPLVSMESILVVVTPVVSRPALRVGQSLGHWTEEKALAQGRWRGAMAKTTNFMAGSIVERELDSRKCGYRRLVNRRTWEAIELSLRCC